VDSNLNRYEDERLSCRKIHSHSHLSPGEAYQNVSGCGHVSAHEHKQALPIPCMAKVQQQTSPHHEPLLRGDGIDGSKAPLTAVSFFIVSKVRKDGSPHLRAYSRLPSIRPFFNWDQASSFAVRFEWEHPLNSGKWMCRYLQAGRTQRFTEPNTPGAVWNFANAISFQQWLFGAAPNHSYDRIPHAPGAANALWFCYNLHEQKITIGPSGERLVMVSGARKFADAKTKQLKHPKLGLENVGGGFSQFTDELMEHLGGSAMCALCSLRWHTTMGSSRKAVRGLVAQTSVKSVMS
jgi:hypothetical protein